ncbi:MAG: hypothetical protein ABIL09_17620, partial [Gemmatimonadota bacterium]
MSADGSPGRGGSELRRAQGELEQARDRYADLHDFAPVGCLTGAALLGVESGALVGRRFSAFVVREDEDAFYLYRRRAAAGEPGTC